LFTVRQSKLKSRGL